MRRWRRGRSRNLRKTKCGQTGNTQTGCQIDFYDSFVTSRSLIPPGTLRGGHPQVHQEDVGGDTAAEMVLGWRSEPELQPKRK